MLPPRKPESVTDEFLKALETANDERLAALLTEKCDFTDYYEDIDEALSITDKIPEQAGDEFGTWLAGALEISIGDRPLRLLTRLAILGHEKTFRLVREALRGWSPSPSLNGSYVHLPTAKVFLVQWEHYLGVEEPTHWRNSVESGEAARGEVAAWPHDEEGYIEAFAGSIPWRVGDAIFFEVVYDLNAATFEALRASAKTVGEEWQLELDRDHIHLYGDALDSGTSLTSAFSIARCSANFYGDRKKDPSVVTLVFNGDLE